MTHDVGIVKVLISSCSLTCEHNYWDNDNDTAHIYNMLSPKVLKFKYITMVVTERVIILDPTENFTQRIPISILDSLVSGRSNFRPHLEC